MLWYNNAQGGGIILNQSGLFFKKKKIHMRIKFFLIALAVFLIGVSSIFLLYGWFMQKQERVLAGTARTAFPYNDYSIDELNTMYPQYVNENVKTTQTPEETYEKFREALRKGDLDGAVSCCFRQGDQEKIREGLAKVEAKELLDNMINDLNELKISYKMDLDNESRATYYYSSARGDKELGSSIDFIKNSQGVWLIESL
jgi:hypothetical protein